MHPVLPAPQADGAGRNAKWSVPHAVADAVLVQPLQDGGKWRHGTPKCLLGTGGSARRSLVLAHHVTCRIFGAESGAEARSFSALLTLTRIG
jgi:hypothetical protein